MTKWAVGHISSLLKYIDVIGKYNTYEKYVRKNNVYPVQTHIYIYIMVYT